MGKKVRVWICWRFHWLTVGTDKWGPPSFTIWPTATLFLIKCSILKGHVSTCLDPSKLDQDGESRIEASPLPGWSLLPLGSTPCPWRNQPALLLRPSPRGCQTSWPAFVLPQAVWIVRNRVLSSPPEITERFRLEGTSGGPLVQRQVQVSGKPTWFRGRGLLPTCASTTHVWAQSLGLPKEKKIPQSKTQFLLLWPPTNIPHCQWGAFQSASAATWQR